MWWSGFQGLSSLTVPSQAGEGGSMKGSLELPNTRRKHWRERGVSFPYVLICARGLGEACKPKIGEPSMARKGSHKGLSLSSSGRLFPVSFHLLHNPPLPSLSSLWVRSYPSFWIHPSPISMFLCPSSYPPYFLRSYLPLLHSRSPLRLSVFPPPAFGSVRRTQLGTSGFREHHFSAEGWLLPRPWREKLALRSAGGFLRAPLQQGRVGGRTCRTTAVPASGTWEAHCVDLFGASLREFFWFLYQSLRAECFSSSLTLWLFKPRINIYSGLNFRHNSDVQKYNLIFHN